MPKKTSIVRMPKTQKTSTKDSVDVVRERLLSSEGEIIRRTSAIEKIESYNALESGGCSGSRREKIEVVDYETNDGEACVWLYKGRIMFCQANTPGGERFLFDRFGVLLSSDKTVFPYGVVVGREKVKKIGVLMDDSTLGLVMSFRNPLLNDPFIDGVYKTRKKDCIMPSNFMMVLPFEMFFRLQGVLSTRWPEKFLWTMTHPRPTME